jgi:hypothetical protein
MKDLIKEYADRLCQNIYTKNDIINLLSDLLKENSKILLNKYYNYLMDEFRGYASEEAIDLFIQKEFEQ